MIVKEISFAFYCEKEDCGESESYFLGSGGSRQVAVQIAKKDGWKIIHSKGFKKGIHVKQNILCPKCSRGEFNKNSAI
tara:strand:+ start:1957 stop:2190 length:234 start_codon:yes stop_codon:yes gene_type:complete